jgi:hypothetical protein
MKAYASALGTCSTTKRRWAGYTMVYHMACLRYSLVPHESVITPHTALAGRESVMVNDSRRKCFDKTGTNAMTSTSKGSASLSSEYTDSNPPELQYPLTTYYSAN